MMIIIIAFIIITLIVDMKLSMIKDRYESDQYVVRSGCYHYWFVNGHEAYNPGTGNVRCQAIAYLRY